MENLPSENTVWNSLSEHDQLVAASKIIGYRQLPPTIEEFIESKYYLGNSVGDGAMYPFWKEKLKELFPSPIHTSNTVIVAKGAIGTGKSFFSRVAAMYTECRLSMLENLRFFGLASGKTINTVFFHVNNTKAYDDFISPCYEWGKESPFFTEIWDKGTKIPTAFVADGPRTSAIGGDVVFYNLSEINFVDYEVASHKLDTAVKRFESRFGLDNGYLGCIVLDSSSQGDDAIVDEFIANNPFNPMVISVSQWEAKAHTGKFGNHGWTKCYCGDSVNQPFLFENGKVLLESMDPTRVIEIPNELLPQFRFDIITSLQDLAGVSTKSTGIFLQDKENFKSSLSIKSHIPETVIVDMYDRTDRIFDKIQHQLSLIPKDRIIFPRFDIGVVNDLTGFSISYFEEFKQFSEGSSLKEPVYKTPVQIGIGRKPGQETSISHLLDLCLDLAKLWEIGEVTADQYASRQLFQDLDREGIRSRYLSVDRTDEAYIYWKNVFNAGRWTGMYNSILEKEVCELKHQGGKIDHPNDGCFVGDTMVLVKSKRTHEILKVKFKDLLYHYDSYLCRSYDPKKSQFTWENIDKVFVSKEVEELCRVIIGNFEVYCTPEHRFLTDKGYKHAQDLVKGDMIASDISYNVNSLFRFLSKSCGYIRVTSSECFQCFSTEVYDLTCNANSNFCLGNTSVVHNSKDISDATCGSIYSCYQNLELAQQIASVSKATIQNDLVSAMLDYKNGNILAIARNLFK